VYKAGGVELFAHKTVTRTELNSLVQSMYSSQSYWSDIEVWHLLDSINAEFSDFFVIKEPETSEKTKNVMTDMVKSRLK
jgi:hypothetical protein